MFFECRFTMTANVFSTWRRRRFLALNFIRSTELGFCTSFIDHEPTAFAKRQLVASILVKYNNSKHFYYFFEKIKT